MIGCLLGLRSEQLNIIEHDYIVRGAESCCNATLEKWLQVDAKASWKKLIEAIRSLEVKQPTTSSTSKQGLLLVYIYMLCCFIIW